MTVEAYQKQYREQQWRKVREGLGSLAMVISSLFLGLAYNDYQSLIQSLRGEGIPFDIPLETWVNIVNSGVVGVVTDLIIGFIFLALGIFLMLFKGTNRQLVGVLVTASSIALFMWGFHEASSDPGLVIISLVLILIGIWIFIPVYKRKSSPQIAAPSTTT